MVFIQIIVMASIPTLVVWLKNHVSFYCKPVIVNVVVGSDASVLTKLYFVLSCFQLTQIGR